MRATLGMCINYTRSMHNEEHFDLVPHHTPQPQDQRPPFGIEPTGLMFPPPRDTPLINSDPQPLGKTAARRRPIAMFKKQTQPG